jgi:hypothetical protein
VKKKLVSRSHLPLNRNLARQKRRVTVQNIFKKVKKKLVSRWHLPLNGNLARQKRRVTVQNIFKKVKKSLSVVGIFR